MTKSIGKIEKELESLTENIKQLAQEFKGVFAEYLSLLNSTVSQQLILAAFRLSTEHYPQEFLKLSYSQRESLQQELRLLGRVNLTELIDISIENNDQTKLEFIHQLAHLLTWLEQLEEKITHQLDSISNQANRMLKTAKILPEKIPLKILEMTITSDPNPRGINSSPNLLNLLIESSVEEERLGNNPPPTIVMKLRLTEIELANYQLNNCRQKIRQMQQQLSQLKQQYDQKQQEYFKASAASAWRSSWHED